MTSAFHPKTWRIPVRCSAKVIMPLTTHNYFVFRVCGNKFYEIYIPLKFSMSKYNKINHVKVKFDIFAKYYFKRYIYKWITKKIVYIRETVLSVLPITYHQRFGLKSAAAYIHTHYFFSYLLKDKIKIRISFGCRLKNLASVIFLICVLKIVEIITALWMVI